MHSLRVNVFPMNEWIHSLWMDEYVALTCLFTQSSMSVAMISAVVKHESVQKSLRIVITKCYIQLYIFSTLYLKQQQQQHNLSGIRKALSFLKHEEFPTNTSASHNCSRLPLSLKVIVQVDVTEIQ